MSEEKQLFAVAAHFEPDYEDGVRRAEECAGVFSASNTLGEVDKWLSDQGGKIHEVRLKRVDNKIG